MAFKQHNEKLDKTLNNLVNNNIRLTKQEIEEVKQIERYITELKVRAKQLQTKIESVRQVDRHWYSSQRKEKRNDNQLDYDLKTAVRMAYLDAMPLMESDFYANFYESLGDYGQYFLATEEQLIKAQTLAFGEHYRYLYTFIKID